MSGFLCLLSLPRQRKEVPPRTGATPAPRGAIADASDSGKTAKQQNSKTAKQQNSKTAKQQNGKINLPPKAANQTASRMPAPGEAPRKAAGRRRQNHHKPNLITNQASSQTKPSQTKTLMSSSAAPSP
ncbi:hypothetical protein J8I87_06260 [Paraburkholderia sp. LEh10]|uniref:hypothetical protein n=1 Tax=Paraburkholderia sp. LEh10 TaxID=2821353 RepID=UPI001AE2C9B0|nr:hypothetical protein [Paraburkholderia sp. LEh10]MBP0589327.1 hypothetical protein [Paraburkholderia sp. LEh10]